MVYESVNNARITILICRHFFLCGINFSSKSGALEFPILAVCSAYSKVNYCEYDPDGRKNDPGRTNPPVILAADHDDKSKRFSACFLLLKLLELSFVFSVSPFLRCSGLQAAASAADLQ